MDIKITGIEQTHEDGQSVCPYSLRASPRCTSLFFGKELNPHLRFSYSPIVEDQVLSRSLVFNDLEDMDNNVDQCFINIRSNDNCVKMDKGQPQLLLGGTPYIYRDTPATTDVSYFKKRESILSTQTTHSDTPTTVNQLSPLAFTDSRVMVDIRRLEAIKSHIKDSDIKTDKLNRRMSTFHLNRFNSFSLTSPLLAQSKDLNESSKASKRSKKINKKSSQRKETTQESIKMQSDKTTLCSRTISDYADFPSVDANHRENADESTNFHDSSKLTTSTSVLEFPTKVDTESSICVQRILLDHRSA